MNNVFEVLDTMSVKTGINDNDLEKVLRMFEDHLDNQFYTKAVHETIEVSRGKYNVQFIESNDGYYMTVIDTEDKSFRKVFVSLNRGDWVIDFDFFKNPKNMEYLIAFGVESNKFIEDTLAD